MRASFSFPRERQEPGAKQAAEKLRMNDERAKFEGCETINQPSRIVPRASWCDPFFALSDKLSFSAACLAPAGCPILSRTLRKGGRPQVPTSGNHPIFRH